MKSYHGEGKNPSVIWQSVLLIFFFSVITDLKYAVHGFDHFSMESLEVGYTEIHREFHFVKEKEEEHY